MIFFLFISNVHLGFGDDNVAEESNVKYQETYKVYPEGVHLQQQGQNFQSVEQSFGKDVESNLKEAKDVRQNQFQITVQKYKTGNGLGESQISHQQQLHLRDDSKQNTISTNEGQTVHEAQSGSHIQYIQPQQEIYVQYPQQQIQILGAQAAQLQQINDGPEIGYTSYIEHFSTKDEEEMKSALKEGTLKDIKRLVPKSGISFRIYNNEKKTNVQNTGTQTNGHNYLLLNNQGKQVETSQNTRLRHKLTDQPPAIQHYEQIETPQELYITNGIGEQQQNIENTHQGVQLVGTLFQDPQRINVQNTYYSQIEGSSPKPTLVTISGKSSVDTESQYNINGNGEDFGKGTSNIQFVQNSNSVTRNKIINPAESYRREKLQYKKYGNVQEAKFKKPVNQIVVQPIETIRYQVSPTVSSETAKLASKGIATHVSYSGHEGVKSGLSNFINNSPSNPYVGLETETGSNGNYISQKTSSVTVEGGQNNYIGYTTAAPQFGQEPAKPTHETYIRHVTISPYIDIDASKGNQAPYVSHTTATPYKSSVAVTSNYGESVSDNLYADSETAKSTQHGVVSISPSSYVNIQTGKSGLSSFVNHLTTGSRQNDESYSIGQNNFESHVTPSYEHIEPEKENLNKFISHTSANTYIETEGTNSQNNFDHQKALEGSTSFDIKNAIGNTEVHHNTVIYATPSPETPHVEKQTLAYLKIPVLPTSSSLIGEHQNKNFGHGAVSEYSYPAVSLPIVAEVNGKYFSQPQTVSIWTSNHFKQGNGLATNDLHQPLIKLHLPKEELHHLKTSHVELPTSFLSHNSFTQKQPIGFHQELSPLKVFKEIYYQPVKSHQIQNLREHQLKIQPVLHPEWNFQKIKYPNLNTNNVVGKTEIMAYLKEPGKKVIPILIKKRKNRSNKDVGVIYGKTNGNRGPVKPHIRQEKNIHGNLFPEASNNLKTFDTKNERKNEFSVSASYKVDRSMKKSDNFRKTP